MQDTFKNDCKNIDVLVGRLTMWMWRHYVVTWYTSPPNSLEYKTFYLGIHGQTLHCTYFLIHKVVYITGYLIINLIKLISYPSILGMVFIYN